MKRILKYAKPFRLGIVGVAILVFVQAMSDLYLPNLMSMIINNGIMQGDIGYIWKIGAAMLGVTLIAAAAVISMGFLSARISAGFAKNIRADLFRKIESFSPSEFDRFGAASLITRTTNDITQIQMFALMSMRIVLMAPIICIGGVIMAVSKNPQLSLVIVAAMPVLFLMITFVAKKALPLSSGMQKRIDRVNLVMREKLTGIRVIRAFNRIDHEQKRFDQANQELTDISIKMNRIMSFLMPALMLIMNLTQIAVVWFGGYRIDAGTMLIGDLMAFIQYVMQIMMALTMLSFVFVMLPRASTSLSRINEVLDVTGSIIDPANPKQPGAQKGYIEFRDVTFRYPDAEDAALHNISFKACPGETTAIIGSTGCGKSTLIHLIPRFYDIQEGSILIDGVDIRKYSIDTLRQKIGFVPQKAVLFSGTIEDNIRQGNEQASEAEIRKAAMTAQAMEFIEAKEEKFKSPVAQGGTNISGGQKQRLSIARALARKAEIYIFDDSFSALDFKTDAALRKALKQETSDSTVLIVAQRVSTVMDADRILVLNEGELVGMGTHQELLKTCAVYHEIVASQLTEEEIA